MYKQQGCCYCNCFGRAVATVAALGIVDIVLMCAWDFVGQNLWVNKQGWMVFTTNGSYITSETDVNRNSTYIQ